LLERVIALDAERDPSGMASFSILDASRAAYSEISFSRFARA
jgi:hypothetical protein